MDMKQARNATAMLAALGLLGAAPAWAQSAADQPSSQTAPTGGYEKKDATMGAAREGVTDAELAQYIETRRALQQSHPEAWAAVESGDFATKEQTISTALTASGSSLSVEEFERVHQRVVADDSLRARVEQETGTSRSGAGAPLPSGPALGTGPSSVTGGTPPDTQRPELGTGAPTGDQSAGGTTEPGTSGAAGTPGGSSSEGATSGAAGTSGAGASGSSSSESGTAK